MNDIPHFVLRKFLHKRQTALPHNDPNRRNYVGAPRIETIAEHAGVRVGLTSLTFFTSFASFTDTFFLPLQNYCRIFVLSSTKIENKKLKKKFLTS